MVLGDPLKGSFVPQRGYDLLFKSLLMPAFLVYENNSSAKWDNALLAYKLTFIPN